MNVLRANNLSGLTRIAHGFFGRQGGVSEGIFASLNCGPGSPDDRAHVIENRRRVMQMLHPEGHLVTPGQFHSANVLTVTKPWRIGDTRKEDVLHIPLGDAMVTNVSGIALGILTADCAPVLLTDVEARVIGAAHAGWKGALGGITDATIEAMEKLGARRDRIAAAIGPCIAQANYEVGPEFRERYLSADSGNDHFFITSSRANHFRFDLEGYVAHRLHAGEIGSIEPLSACTYARESEFFSFRRTTHRNEPDYGREISAIVLI